LRNVQPQRSQAIVVQTGDCPGRLSQIKTGTSASQVFLRHLGH
jgi:hypothetical protein